MKGGCEKLHVLSSTEDVEKKKKRMNNEMVGSQTTIFAYLYHTYKTMSKGNWNVASWDNIKELTQMSEKFSLFNNFFFIKRTNWIAINCSLGVN